MPKTITKKELAEAIAVDHSLTKYQAGKCVDAIFAALRGAVLQGNRIEIRGFGAWEVRETNPRPKARNPRTGEAVCVPARRKVMFRVGKELREELKKPI